MSAVVGVLNESLTESIKGFYKLRKAFVTLDGIMQAETRYMRGLARKTSSNSLRSNRSARSARVVPGDFGDVSDKPRPDEKPPVHPLGQSNGLDAPEDDDDDEFYDAAEVPKESPSTSKYTGDINTNGTNHDFADLSMKDTEVEESGTHQYRQPQIQHEISHNPEHDIFKNPIDLFIHSGTNLCFGILLLLISMIPPAFGKLLFIIGFRGDRDRGIRMLWQASKFENINGAMAGLILLGYYNGLVSFCDVLPEPPVNAPEALTGYPRKRCETLLATMRTRYPRSRLWLLEQARMEASNRNLPGTLSLLTSAPESPLKQVHALSMFELSLNAMYIHDYTLCADSFLTCITLNNWSHALYYYIAGSCHIELYRQHKLTNPTLATKHAEKATDLLRNHVGKHAGKKKFMARQLPFDVFVMRKIAKWDSRAKEWNISFPDAVGISPIEEMIFFWNGYKRMRPAELEPSLAALSWSENTSQNLTWPREGADEKAILAVLRATTLRNMGRDDEAMQILKTEVLHHDKSTLKGGLRDDWTLPAAHYEMGVNCWGKRHQGEEWVKRCEEWVKKAAAWEGYELDARIGVKATMALETVGRVLGREK